MAAKTGLVQVKTGERPNFCEGEKMRNHVVLTFLLVTSICNLMTSETALGNAVNSSITETKNIRMCRYKCHCKYTSEVDRHSEVFYEYMTCFSKDNIVEGETRDDQKWIRLVNTAKTFCQQVIQDKRSKGLRVRIVVDEDNPYFPDAGDCVYVTEDEKLDQKCDVPGYIWRKDRRIDRILREFR